MATYTDPRTGEERNLGQQYSSVATSWIGGLVMVAVIGLAGWYFYSNISSTPKTINEPSTAATMPSHSSTPQTLPSPKTP